MEMQCALHVNLDTKNYTVNEAQNLKTECRSMFDFLEKPKLGWNWSDNLIVFWDKKSLTFNLENGDIARLDFYGSKEEFDEICGKIKIVVTNPENNRKLKDLYWLYTHHPWMVKES